MAEMSNINVSLFFEHNISQQSLLSTWGQALRHRDEHYLCCFYRCIITSGTYITFFGSLYSLLEVNHRDVVMSTTTTTNEVSSCLVWLKKGHWWDTHIRHCIWLLQRWVFSWSLYQCLYTTLHWVRKDCASLINILYINTVLIYILWPQI